MERLVWGGRGLGHTGDGRVVLISSPLALFPCETVTAQVRMRARHGEGNVTGWVQRDPRRTAAACPLAAGCGGCDLWEAGAELPALKRLMVEDLFGRNLPAGTVWDWLPAPPGALRSRIQLHWDGSRLGFHRRGSNDVIAAQACPLAAAPVSAAIPALADALRGGGLPEQPGRWELATGTPPGDVIATAEHEPDRAWRLGAAGWGECAAQDAVLMHRLGDAQLRQSAGAFFQACPPWAWEAFAGLMDAWRVAGDVLFDLYGGGGFFSRMLAPAFSRSELVESAPAAVADARANLAGMATAVHSADVAAWMPAGPWAGPDDVVVLDPPRSGLAPQVMERLGACRAGMLVLVGCDGAVFCRDAGRLAEHWRLVQLAAVDLFPNTVHVECIGLFRRAR